ncbi:hypothetical protein ASPCADRAFT_132451 [Aspergillus carbonarius ITEM 5010]|uniref:Uncharacterized protein n=1 Tax=Aspergillus carbonarius (strain ITEM 5010) TaxID=602072 RepID=A0A1R3RG11_ASPC5|nr:hypothetical protein ASPCADRAFT_132451 [Aspergillus carbonarius ITEM 5010]
MSSTLRPRLHIHTSTRTLSSFPPIPIPTHLRPLPPTTTLLSRQLWTTLHPSTLSIYTHFLPSLLLFILTIFISITINSPAKPILILNLLAATTTLLLSTTYHLHEHTPPTTANQFLCYDYTGIILLIVANYITGLYFGFYSHQDLSWRYISLILLLSTFPITTHLTPRYQSLEFDNLRVISLVLTALTALIPIVHGYGLYGGEYLWNVGVGWYLFEGAVFILGVGVYWTRIPERWFPESFWVEVCNSHVVWHVCVVVGIGVHFMGVISVIQFWFGKEML